MQSRIFGMEITKIVNLHKFGNKMNKYFTTKEKKISIMYTYYKSINTLWACVYAYVCFVVKRIRFQSL